MYHHSTPNSNPIPDASGIYRVTCIPTGKFYIGSSINLHRRQQDHFRELRKNIHGNPKLQHAWNKYGEDAFVFEVLELVLILETLTAREQYWFKVFNPFENKGFNIHRVAGSSLGHVVSAETREKLRVVNLGKPSPQRGTTLSPEHVEKLRVSHRGQPGYWTGKKRDPEVVEKIAAARRGKPSTRIGYKASPETRERLRVSHLGKTLSEETRRKMSGKLIVTAPDGTEYFVHGIGKFCQEHNLHTAGLLQVAKGTYTQHKGWTARFPETD